MNPTALIQEGLREIGFYRLCDEPAQLLPLIKSMAERADGRVEDDRFVLVPFAFASQRQPRGSRTALVIDIGGTRTRAAIHANGFGWQCLLDARYAASSLRNGEVLTAGHYREFCVRLAKRLVRGITRAGLSLSGQVDCAVVWSNYIENIRTPYGYDGAVRRTGAFYNKGERFLQDLQDGDLVGRPVLEALAAQGIEAGALLVCNDVPLVMLAGEEADGGMIASTGVNGTLLRRESAQVRLICNAEMGRVIVPTDLLSAADGILPPYRNRTAPTRLGQMIGGRYLPFVLGAHLVALSESAGWFKRLRPLLQSSEHALFPMELMAAVAADPRAAEAFPLQPREAALLSALVSEVLRRAGGYGAYLCYGSVVPQFAEKKGFKIAVESSLARHFPVFESALRRRFAELMRVHEKDGALQLILPFCTASGEISVPMMGAVKALHLLTPESRPV